MFIQKWLGVVSNLFLLIAIGCSASPSNQSSGSKCGNNKIEEPFEDCDGTDLDGMTCQDIGFLSGTLSCDTTCAFDTSKCTGKICGNGKIDTDADEQCEGTNLDSQTCQSLGYTGGTLACDPDYCRFDASQCTGNPCGNGKIDTGADEQCEGANLDSQTCQSLGYTGGTLTCDSDYCVFDFFLCAGNPCGNGKIDSLEECDGADLGGKTCQSLGFSSGTLSCDSKDCWLDTQACID